MSNAKRTGVIIHTDGLIHADGARIYMTPYQNAPHPKLRAVLCGEALKMSLNILTDADKAEVLQSMGIIVLTPEAVEDAKEVQS